MTMKKFLQDCDALSRRTFRSNHQSEALVIFPQDRLPHTQRAESMTGSQCALAHNGDKRETMHYNDVEDQP